MTQSADYLQATKKWGKSWYNSYAGKPGSRNGHILVITPTTYPNVLFEDPSMYSRRAMFDMLSGEAKKFYESRGVKAIIAGPEGLGGGFEIAGLYMAIVNFGTPIMHWLSANWSTLAKILLPLAKAIKNFVIKKAEEKQLKTIRQTRVRIALNLCLYIDNKTPSDDLVPYAEQLLVSAQDLYFSLTPKMPHINVAIGCDIRDTRSDKIVDITVSSYTNRLVSKALRKLRKAKPSSTMIRVSV